MKRPKLKLESGVPKESSMHWLQFAVYSRVPNKRRATLINFWAFFQGLFTHKNIQNMFLYGFELCFQGDTFIVFAKCSKGYVYSRGYVYSGLLSTLHTRQRFQEAGMYNVHDISPKIQAKDDIF